MLSRVFGFLWILFNSLMANASHPDGDDSAQRIHSRCVLTMVESPTEDCSEYDKLKSQLHALDKGIGRTIGSQVRSL